MLKNLKSLFSPEQITAIFSGSNFNKSKKTESQYGNMLRESRKIRLLYGNLSKKYLQKLFQNSHYFPCQTDETIFTLLESRLDVVLYRSGFFKSIATARQSVHTGGIEINKKKVISPATKIVPGDIVCVLKKNSKKQAKQSTIFARGLDFDTNSQLKKKEIGWRFKASPFLLALSLYQRKSKQNQNTKNNNFKTKWIESTFYKCKLILFSKSYWSLLFPQENSINAPVTDLRCNALPCTFDAPQNEKAFVSREVKQSKNFSLETVNESITSSKNKDKFLTEQQSKLLNNWFFSNYLLFLKKQFVSSTKKLFLSKQKKNSFDGKPSKTLKIGQKKVACFLKQKNLSFFKEQHFFDAKKGKPLHLEISYKSLSIVFLFPPQRVSFPAFINVSQIYK